jgi:hypothetical protein
VRDLSAGQIAILSGEAGAGFIAYLMQLDHPDGPVRFWSGAAKWIDAEGREWLGGAGVLSVGAAPSKSGFEGGALKIVWPGAPVALVTIARDGRVAGSAFTLSRGFFAPSGAIIGAPLVDFIGLCEQPEIDVDPARMEITLTVESRLIRLGRARPVRLTPADWGRWFGTGAGRDTGFDFVAALQNSDPFE